MSGSTVSALRARPREGKTAPQVQQSRDQTKGEATRERLLAIAEASIIAKGFGATSIEEIIAEAGLTKSGFFYHFRDKNELARELMTRHAREDEALFDDLFGRARALTDDPLQVFLIGLKLLADVMADLPGGHPGCLVSSVCYQERLFDREVREINRAWVAGWRTRFLAHLEEIAAVHPPREPVSLLDLADMLSGVMEGGIILGKVLGEAEVLERQILTYRSLVKRLFSPA